jgi:hypothetical protein
VNEGAWRNSVIYTTTQQNQRTKSERPHILGATKTPLVYEYKLSVIEVGRPDLQAPHLQNLPRGTPMPEEIQGREGKIQDCMEESDQAELEIKRSYG